MRLTELLLLLVANTAFAAAVKTNQHAYITGSTNGSISICDVSDNGMVANCKITTHVKNPSHIVINRAKTRAFVTSFGGIYSCPVQTDGNLGECQRTALNLTWANAIMLSPDERYAYIGNYFGSSSSYLSRCMVEANGELTQCLTNSDDAVKDITYNAANNRLYYFSDQGFKFCAIDGNGMLQDCNTIADQYPIYSVRAGQFNKNGTLFYWINSHGLNLSRTNQDGSLNAPIQTIEQDGNSLVLSADNTALYLVDDYLHSITTCSLNDKGEIGSCTRMLGEFTNPLFAFNRRGDIAYVRNSGRDFGYYNLNHDGTFGVFHPIFNDFTAPSSIVTNKDDSIAYFANSFYDNLTYCKLNTDGSLGHCAKTGNGFKDLSYMVMNQSGMGIFTSNRYEYTNFITYCPFNTDGSLGNCHKTYQGDEDVYFSKTGHYIYLVNNKQIQNCRVAADHSFVDCHLFELNYMRDNGWSFALTNDGTGAYILYASSLTKRHLKYCQINSDGSEGRCTDAKGDALGMPYSISLSPDNKHAYFDYAFENLHVCDLTADHTLANCKKIEDQFAGISGITLS